ncbi:DUF6292 family protein [Amycolatopsis suaedae]|uniref:DUF6292 domain-containing protein n=1 Tax=Amycolatopsis suaedae TaxID=2510978 RepID=A0A4Q7J9Z6_9PSEU|nr:DUF6292 family protein [Amycolatopsis suaedae]RZQ63838.1 hypothetical protein EWH70_11810 [Amycolatopsis suaedae]
MNDPVPAVSLARGVAAYLGAVARAVGVPLEATSFEVSDTVTAYLGLARRWSRRPDHDLMLTWSERHGWALAVETAPGERATVVAYLDSADVVPEPEAVAGFVTDVLAGRREGPEQPVYGTTVERGRLAAQLARYVTD